MRQYGSAVAHQLLPLALMASMACWKGNAIARSSWHVASCGLSWQRASTPCRKRSTAPEAWRSRTKALCSGTPAKVSAHAAMYKTGVDQQTFLTFEYADGAMAHLECSFVGCLTNEVSIVGETGKIRVCGPVQAPET